MGLAQARLADLGVGICCCHDPCIPMTGQIITYSTNVLCNGRGAARITDIVLGACGHTGILVTSSGSVGGNSLGLVRVSDLFTGCFTGNIVTGSSNTFSG